MSRVTLENNDIFDPIIRRGLKLASLEVTAADNFALDANMPPLIILDAAGAIDVLMPAATGNKGLCFFISNISGSTITFKTSGDAAFTTAIVLAAGESAWFFCTGSATAALGWRAIATAAST